MKPNKTYMLVLTSVLLLNSGCSGGRLRNLIGRNDYQSLEELDRMDDAYADRELNDSTIARRGETSRTVSQQRELGEKEPSRFSISRLLKGKTPQADFGEDPFLSPEIAESTTERARDLASRSERSLSNVKGNAVNTVAKTAEQFSDTLSDVEKQAEDLFDDLNTASSTSGNPFGEATKSAKQVVENATSTASHSFSDFMEKRAERLAVETSTPQFDERPEMPKAPVEQYAFDEQPAGEEEERFDFDTLVSGFDSENNEVKTASTAPEADPFPELEDMFGDASAAGQDAPFEAPVPDSAASAFEQAMEQTQDEPAELTHDPFSLASQKHGFGPLGKQDPWAAFDSDEHGDAISWAVGPEKTDEEPGFDWGQPPATEYPGIAKTDTEFTNDSQFMQVASSTTTHDFDSHTDSSTGSLVIPVPAEVSQPTSSFTIPEPVATPAQDDFFGDAEDFQLSEVSIEDAETPEAETSGSSGGLAAITGWPTRTWFFLLGCILVAVLLFLPNRQKQDN